MVYKAAPCYQHSSIIISYHHCSKTYTIKMSSTIELQWSSLDLWLLLVRFAWECIHYTYRHCEGAVASRWNRKQAPPLPWHNWLLQTDIHTAGYPRSVHRSHSKHGPGCLSYNDAGKWLSLIIRLRKLRHLRCSLDHASWMALRDTIKLARLRTICRVCEQVLRWSSMIRI